MKIEHASPLSLAAWLIVCVFWKNEHARRVRQLDQSAVTLSLLRRSIYPVAFYTVLLFDAGDGFLKIGACFKRDVAGMEVKPYREKTQNRIC